MLLISVAQKKGSEVLLNTDEAAAVRAAVGTAALADELHGDKAGVPSCAAGQRASQAGVGKSPWLWLELPELQVPCSGVLPGPGPRCPHLCCSLCSLQACSTCCPPL